MTRLFRSHTYQSLYPDELMLEAFGKLNPSSSEKATYFFEMWVARRSNKIVVHDIKKYEIKDLLRQLGLRELWDYQLKTNEIRFEHKEDLAMFKLAQKGHTS